MQIDIRLIAFWTRAPLASLGPERRVDGPDLARRHLEHLHPGLAFERECEHTDFLHAARRDTPGPTLRDIEEWAQGPGGTALLPLLRRRILTHQGQWQAPAPAPRLRSTRGRACKVPIAADGRACTVVEETDGAGKQKLSEVGRPGRRHAWRRFCFAYGIFARVVACRLVLT